MNQHDQSPCPDVVDQPRKTDEGDGGHMVNYLFFEILVKRQKRMMQELKSTRFSHLLIKL